MNNEYVTTNQATKMLQISTKTISRWIKAGKISFITAPSGRKRFNIKDLYNLNSSLDVTKEKKAICYCRVSSSKQMDDLERQKNFFKQKFPHHELVTDVCIGINWKRKGLKTILERSMQGNISEIVVAHRDRLCRFAFELLEFILSANDVKLVVLNEEKGSSTEQELANDILSIIHVYSCRKMGRRRYKSKEDKTVPKSKTTNDNEEMDGNTEICL